MADKADKRVSIIEVLMVILIVGIIVIIIFPSIDAKRKIEIINNNVKPTFNTILEKNQDFYEENGYRPFLSQLNISALNESEYFSYDMTDSTIIAETKSEFGKPGAKIIYNFEQDRWQIGGKEGVVKEYWLGGI
ncbi:MAG: hypothetical protein KGY75_03410 [Candidatus Cloacimonetes bacterium]|nr:hypothetical protein [Candidatus Cloacimonadota bacterium]MBS3767157.1 hypothetical protein [Candidatus Cloacimonadota bacterium]